MKKFISRYTSTLQQKNGVGLISVLYSLVLSRGHDRIVKDLQDQVINPLVDPVGDVTTPLLNLMLVGKATPYLHNGIMSAVDDVDGADELVGIETRSEIGLMVWENDEDTTAAINLGSRLKTPVLPVWSTRCNGKVGILFNPNRDLMRSYQAENRLQRRESQRAPILSRSGSAFTTTAIRN